MSLIVTFNGSNYIIPTTNEVGWGSNLDAYFIAIAAGALQKTGGLFTLSADVDFGPSFGVLSEYYKTRSANTATTGQYRLAASDTIDFRNNANSANLALGINGSDQLTFNGSPLVPDTFTANRAIMSDGSGDLAVSPVTSTELSYLSGLTIYNVKSYGAIGDNTHDDGPAIAAAYAAAVASGGGIVFIPAGTYKVTSTQITPVSNTVIMGATERATVINWNGTGFWLDNISTGTIMTRFTVKGLQVNCTGNSFCRLGLPNEAFSENNQHIDCWFEDLFVIAPAIVGGTYGFQFNTMIRTHIQDCIFTNFDIAWDFQKFDEAIVTHNRLQTPGTYGLYFHNDTGSIVADESTFIHLDVVGTSTVTASVYLKEVENVRFFNTYLDAGGGGFVPIGWKMNTVYNATIDGATLNSETVMFNLQDVRGLTIANVGLQDPAQSPAPTSVVAFSYNPATDLNGTGGPFAAPDYGLIHVDHCQFLVANAFKGIPGVSVTSNGQYGAGDSHFGGMVSDMSHVYASQILDRNGTNGLLKETGLVISPFSANTYLNGSAPAGFAIVADAAATTGFAIKVPTASANIFMDLPYPGDILPGAYEIMARVRTSVTATASSLIVFYNGSPQENYSGINLTTSYKIINARFNFVPSGSTTVSLRFSASSSADLFVDYIVVRPCANSLTYQTFVESDINVVGNATTPGFKQIYAAAPPSTGTWAVGDLTWNTVPTPTGMLAWTCTAAGTPGTWSPIDIVSGTIPALGSANQLLGVNAGATANEYKTLSGTANEITVTNGTGTITLATPQAIAATSSPTFAALTLTAALTVANGGTGDATFTPYAVIAGGATSTGPLQSVASVGSSGQVLTSNGAGVLPTFQNVAGTGTVNSGTANHLAYYATSTNVVSDLAALQTNASNQMLFGDGALSTPSISFASHPTTGFYMSGADIISWVNAGVESMKIGAAGNASFNFQLRTSDGTVSAPGLTFINSTGSGFYKIGTNDIGFATGGVKAFEVNSSHNTIFNGTVSFVTTSTQGIVGTTTNDNAAAGNVGETVSSFASNVSFPASGNYGDLTSISLTAGDWMVSGVMNYDGSVTSATSLFLGISTTTGNSTTGLTTGDTLISRQTNAVTKDCLTLPMVRMSLASTTTVYLKFSDISSGVPTANGRITAFRIR